MAQLTYGTYMQPCEIKAGGLAIVLSNDARNMEIRPHHLLDMPNYYGVYNEDIIRFLKEFEVLVSRIPLIKGTVTVSEDEI